jgi:hypothetical protein
MTTYNALQALAPVALLLSCATSIDDAPQAVQPLQTSPATVQAPTGRASDAARQPTAALIIEGRKLFVSNGGSCEQWEVEVPNMLEESRGRLRRAAAGGPVVSLDFERQGDDLMLEAPCFGEMKGVCLSCEQLPQPNADTTLRAYARQDECEEAKAGAGIRGCAAAVAESSRDHVRRVLDGSLRDEFIGRVAAARMVSRGSGAGCIPFHVRKSGKRLFLDWEASEYPYEVTTGTGGIVSIDEVAERNPRYRPRGPSEIAIGCCGGDSYHVLALRDGAATLRKLPRSKGETPSVVEFRLSGCSR